MFTHSSFSRSVKKKWVTSGFGLKVILGGSLFVSFHCTLQLSCENIFKISQDQYAWHCCWSILIHLNLINTLDKLVEILEGWRYLECPYHHTRTWQLWWSSITGPKENYCPRYDWFPRLKQIRSIYHSKNWWLLKFYIRLFWLFDNLYCWVNLNW